MNERIKELYNQSLEEKYQYGGSDAKPGEMYSNYITVLNPEKFAELIILECMRMCEVTQMGFETHGCSVEASGAITVKQYIAEHFGVE